MGPSAPLSPIWFDHGVDVVSSSIVWDPERVLDCLSQGGNLHQMMAMGIRKVSILKKSHPGISSTNPKNTINPKDQKSCRESLCCPKNPRGKELGL